MKRADDPAARRPVRDATQRNAVRRPAVRGPVPCARRFGDDGEKVTVSKLALPAFGTGSVPWEGPQGEVGWAEVIDRVKMTEGKASHTAP